MKEYLVVWTHFLDVFMTKVKFNQTREPDSIKEREWIEAAYLVHYKEPMDQYEKYTIHMVCPYPEDIYSF